MSTAIDWPSTLMGYAGAATPLPDYPQGDGYLESPSSTAILADTDVGPPKSRGLVTVAPVQMVWPFFLTSEQVDTLDAFYRGLSTDDPPGLEGGKLSFNNRHPRLKLTVGAQEYLFIEKPSWSARGDLWVASLELLQVL